MYHKDFEVMVQIKPCCQAISRLSQTETRSREVQIASNILLAYLLAYFGIIIVVPDISDRILNFGG